MQGLLDPERTKSRDFDRVGYQNPLICVLVSRGSSTGKCVVTRNEISISYLFSMEDCGGLWYALPI